MGELPNVWCKNNSLNSSFENIFDYHRTEHDYTTNKYMFFVMFIMCFASSSFFSV